MPLFCFDKLDTCGYLSQKHWLPALLKVWLWIHSSQKKILKIFGRKVFDVFNESVQSDTILYNQTPDCDGGTLGHRVQVLTFGDGQWVLISEKVLSYSGNLLNDASFLSHFGNITVSTRARLLPLYWGFPDGQDQGNVQRRKSYSQHHICWQRRHLGCHMGKEALRSVSTCWKEIPWKSIASIWLLKVKRDLSNK